MNNVLDQDWTQFGFNQFLVRTLQADPDYQSSDDYNALVQDGAITSAKMKSVVADKIIAGTITGSTVQTAASGERVVINGDDNNIILYDSAGNYVGYLYADTGKLLLVSSLAATAGGITIDSDTAIIGPQDGNVRLNAIDASFHSNVFTLTPTLTTANTDIKPETDNVTDLGSSSKRWKLIRGVTITSGDLGWEEKECYLCKKKFKIGDRLSLIIKKIDKNKEPLTVPIHYKCSI